jgi:hypothetical protein
MSSFDPRPAPGVVTLDEQRKRRKAGWSAFVPPLIAAVYHVVAFPGWHDYSFIWKLSVVSGAVGLYWLWLSSPRAGSARYEALITKHAVRAVPLALLAGAFVALLLPL